MQNRNAILIIGSPKPFGSTSEKLGVLLIKHLELHGFVSVVEHIGKSIRNSKLDDLVRKVNCSDIVIISTPLYIDSLPSQLIRFLEIYRNDNQKINKRLIGIVNSGFPESFQNDYAIENLRLFANYNGFNWVGGFKIGGGGAFEKVNIEKNKMAKHIVEAFKKTAAYLAKNEVVPNEIFKQAAEQFMPKSMYTIFGQAGWIFHSMYYGTTFKLWNKPYSPSST